MKAFTLRFDDKELKPMLGIQLLDCIDQNRNRVVGLPVPIGKYSVLQFPDLPSGITVTDFDIREERGFLSTNHANHAVAAIYIPKNACLQYASLAARSPEKRCLGGVPVRNQNTDALLLLQEMSCTILTAISKSRNAEIEIALTFDGFALTADVNRSRPLSKKYTCAENQKDSFGTNLADLLKKK